MKRLFESEMTRRREFNFWFWITIILSFSLGFKLCLLLTPKPKIDPTHYMVWEMDKSCFKQIKNSEDGILRLKISKADE